MAEDKSLLASVDCPITRLPDHLLIEIFIRVPIVEWGQVSRVSRNWADLFRQECLWNAALFRCFPLARHGERWPGPIPRGMSKRFVIRSYLWCYYVLDINWNGRSSSVCFESWSMLVLMSIRTLPDEAQLAHF